jgi:hypothetical protein
MPGHTIFPPLISFSLMNALLYHYSRGNGKVHDFPPPDLRLTLTCSRAYTEISVDGIRTRNVLSTKQVAWPDVRDIKVGALEKRTMHVIEIERRNGRTFPLGAPVDSPIMSDPDFKAKLERIVAAWRQMSVAAGN